MPKPARGRPTCKESGRFKGTGYIAFDNCKTSGHTNIILLYDKDMIVQRTTKIAISLPRDMLKAVEQERKRSGESRSELFRRAVDMLLRSYKERTMTERYIRAYEQIPETKEEIKAIRHTASDVLAGEPW
ncbi:MAG: hypothetical protein A2Z02_06705 [Chloroflexi bacterium RBG_16_48_7]|nr:MAG: hypothetical protein A2Z02_06705 [Chloroflexi bacterium RBG_16_48_7]